MVRQLRALWRVSRVWRVWRVSTVSMVSIVATCLIAASPAGEAQSPSSSRPTRDTPGQSTSERTEPVPAGLISGRVLAADTGRPVKRARVLLNAAELPAGRGALTDDDGLFEFVELPQGRYTLGVSKSGFVALTYGQRRPLQAGTPLQLNDGEQLKALEFRLPRGSVIAGHVVDETGDSMAGVDGARDEVSVRPGLSSARARGLCRLRRPGTVPHLGTQPGRLLRHRGRTQLHRLRAAVRSGGEAAAASRDPDPEDSHRRASLKERPTSAAAARRSIHAAHQKSRPTRQPTIPVSNR